MWRFRSEVGGPRPRETAEGDVGPPAFSGTFEGSGGSASEKVDVGPLQTLCRGGSWLMSDVPIGRSQDFQRVRPKA